MKTNVKKYTYNDEFISNKEKDEKQFGEKIADLIYSEWWGGGEYSKRKQWIVEMRKFATGTHDMNFYKNWLCGATNNELSKYFNVDFKTRLKILPTILNLIKNNIDETFFEPRSFAIDPISQEKRKNFRDGKISLMVSQDLLKNAKESLGIDLIGNQEIPQSIEEIDLDMELNYKTKIEKAEDLLISTILNDNYFKETIKPKINEDLVDIGIGVLKCIIDNRRGLVIEYVDPENWGHSFTNDRFFRDCNYFFEKKDVTIAELKNATKENLDTEQLKKAMSLDSFLNGTNNPLDNVKIPILHFSYKTSHINTIKVKSEDQASREIEDAYDVWYEGIYIIHNSYKKLVKWERMQNIPEYKGSILPPYVAVAPKIRNSKYYSLLNNAIPTFKELQKLDLKIQHLSTELKQNTIEMPESFLTGVDIMGKKYSPEEIMGLFFGKGIKIVFDYDSNGLPYRESGINERPAVNNSNLERAVNLYASRLNQLNYILGVNEYLDGAGPNPKTSVTGLELVQLNSNTRTRHIVDSSLMISLNTCQVISSRLNDLFKYSKELKEIYISKVSSEDVSVLEELQKRDLHYYGIYMSYVPTQKERQELETNIQIALEKGFIDLNAAITIKRIKNIRSAELILKQEIKKNRNRLQQEAKEKMDYNANANAQAALIAEEARRATAKINHEFEMEKMALEYKYKEASAINQGRIDMQVANNSYDGKIIIEELKSGANVDIAKYKKDREEHTRLKVVNQNAKNQSKLIEQRKNGITPNFEDDNQDE